MLIGTEQAVNLYVPVWSPSFVIADVLIDAASQPFSLRPIHPSIEMYLYQYMGVLWSSYFLRRVSGA